MGESDGVEQVVTGASAFSLLFPLAELTTNFRDGGCSASLRVFCFSINEVAFTSFPRCPLSVPGSHPGYVTLVVMSPKASLGCDNVSDFSWFW